MTVIDSEFPTVTRSQLRSSAIIDRAATLPIEIRGTGETVSLVLSSKELWNNKKLVDEYVQLFLRVIIELRRPDPSPVVLGEVRFISEWTVDQRDRFVTGFAEALSGSVATGDPAPVRTFIAAGSITQQSGDHPTFDGYVDEATRARYAERLSSMP